MGKPTITTMTYVQQKILQNSERCYMVGDNLHSDIAGANNAPGWCSILVKTGLYKGGPREIEPHYVVDSVLEAVNLIRRLEKV